MIKPIYIDSGEDSLFQLFGTTFPCRNSYCGVMFVVVVAGTSEIEIDNHPYTLQKGSMLSVLPSHLINVKKCDKGFYSLALAFTFDSMSDFPYMIQSSLSESIERMPVIELSTTELASLEEWHKAISSHYMLTYHSSYYEILRSLLFVFSAEVNSIYSCKPIRSSATHYEEITDLFFKLLHANFRLHRQPAYYCDKLCVSLKYLSTVINKITGHSPSYWIADFTIKEAKSLLRSTSLTITQLSEQLNFPNSSFFARYFKRYVGVAPSEYRIESENSEC